MYNKEVDLWRNILPEMIAAAEHAQSITSKYDKMADETCEKDGECGGE